MTVSEQERIAVAREYFVRLDQGRRDVLDLFHEDAEIYFPKFGIGLGRESLFDMGAGFAGALEYIQHDYDTLRYIAAGEFLAVEGTSKGKMSGTTWKGGETPGGRFCNVFRFGSDSPLIASLHIYLDPDYIGQDEQRFRWGKDRKW